MRFSTLVKKHISKIGREILIIAIGGREIVNNETYEINSFIVESDKKENPNFLFIPTVSKDAGSYTEVINDLFRSLGCKTDTLYLSDGQVNRQEVDKKIENADIIYG